MSFNKKSFKLRITLLSFGGKKLPENNKHVGYKGTAKFVGWMIGLVAIIFEFIMNWIPTTEITGAMITKVLLIAVVAAIGVPAMFYISDIFWSFADKIKETIFG